jgi:ABC-type phosphate/phosphonate transport system ATPase subunit
MTATLLLPSPAHVRERDRRQEAAQLLGLIRHYGRLLAAGAVASRMMASRLGRRQMGALFLHTYRQEVERMFLHHLEEAGLSPAHLGRALALLEWEAERQAASWEANMG